LKLESDSAKDYETYANEFLSVRDSSIINTDEVVQWCQNLGDGTEVVELGAGGGCPVTKALIAEGLYVWAMDASPTLVDKFYSRFPQIPVQCTRIQNFDFFNRSYDGAIAIGLMFLLSPSDQAELISSVSSALVRGGGFLFTAPEQECEWIDVITGTESESLGIKRYEELLATSGFRLRSTFSDSGGNNYFDAVLV